ncbi:MAG: hypothetical protein ACI9DK_002044 [Vicingaceae bacterium]|jgi:hypothetical protein
MFQFGNKATSILMAMFGVGQMKTTKRETQTTFP